MFFACRFYSNIGTPQKHKRLQINHIHKSNVPSLRKNQQARNAVQFKIGNYSDLRYLSQNSRLAFLK